MLTFIGATLFLLALPNDQAPNDQSPNDQSPNDQSPNVQPPDDQRLDDQRLDDQPQRETLRRSIAAGFRFIGSTASLRRLTLAGAVASAGLGLGDATVYAIITDGLRRAPAFAGVTQFVQGIGAVAGGLCAAAAIRRLGEVRVVVAGLALLAIAPPLMATPFLPPVLAGQLAIGTAIPLIVIAVITLLQRLAPMRLQGRVYAAFEVAVTGPQTAGLAIGAALVGVVDYRLILAGEAVLLALSTVLLARQAAREPRDRASSDAREEPVPAP